MVFKFHGRERHRFDIISVVLIRRWVYASTGAVKIDQYPLALQFVELHARGGQRIEDGDRPVCSDMQTLPGVINGKTVKPNECLG